MRVAEIARQAGELVMRFFQKEVAHQLKADRSPVTEADFASHTFLVTTLSRLMPPLEVISEESSDVESKPPPAVGEYWLVDPLDGTKEFLQGKPQFTVNVALMQDHHPVLGVVHAPALNVMYLAQAGQGAWRQQGPDSRVRIRAQAADLSRLTVVASRAHSGPRVKRLLEKLPSPAVTTIGSSLKFCLVAEGRADLYFRDQPTMEWDTAAAQCVVESAGGLVLDLNGEVLRYAKPGLRNTDLVAVGDPNFPWTHFLPAPDNARAFQAFFAALQP